MTWEHPAHLYLKRAKSDQIGLGIPATTAPGSPTWPTSRADAARLAVPLHPTQYEKRMNVSSSAQSRLRPKSAVGTGAWVPKVRAW